MNISNVNRKGDGPSPLMMTSSPRQESKYMKRVNTQQSPYVSVNSCYHTNLYQGEHSCVWWTGNTRTSRVFQGPLFSQQPQPTSSSLTFPWPCSNTGEHTFCPLCSHMLPRCSHFSHQSPSALTIPISSCPQTFDFPQGSLPVRFWVLLFCFVNLIQLR